MTNIYWEALAVAVCSVCEWYSPRCCYIKCRVSIKVLALEERAGSFPQQHTVSLFTSAAAEPWLASPSRLWNAKLTFCSTRMLTHTLRLWESQQAALLAAVLGYQRQKKKKINSRLCIQDFMTCWLYADSGVNDQRGRVGLGRPLKWREINCTV